MSHFHLAISESAPGCSKKDRRMTIRGRDHAERERRLELDGLRGRQVELSECNAACLGPVPAGRIA